MSTQSPAGTLGLARTISDPELSAHFGRFVRQLRFAADGSVVISDPAMFAVPVTEELGQSPHSWYESLSPSSQSSLLLLSVLCRPFDPNPKGVATLLDDEAFRMFWPSPRTASLAEGADLSFGLGTLRGRRLALSEADLRELIEHLPRRAPIETLATAFMGGPGNYVHTMWQVARWSADWTSVYCVTDGRYESGYPFPWLLGFCRSDAVERNFVNLLREGSSQFDAGFYATYGVVRNETRWRLAKLAVIMDEDADYAPWAVVDDLLSLDDNAMDEVLRQCDTKKTLSALERLRMIRSGAEEAGLDDLSLAQLLMRAEAGTSLGKLGEFLTRCPTA